MSSRTTRQEESDAKIRGNIAIIGIAGLFPGAPDLDTYWQNILTKVDSVTDPPPEAWNADIFYDPDSTANDRVYCKRGGYLGPLAYFDPLKYGVMPVTAKGGEPDQWLALRVARAALADAGYKDEIPERHRTAVILGKGTYLNRGNFSVVQHGTVVDQTIEILKTLHPEYSEADLQLIRKELKRDLPPFNSDTVPGLIPNIIAGRIANQLDLMGPSYTVDAACASSFIAIDMAVRDLLSGNCDLALAGGAHVVTPVPVMMVFCHLGALSRQERIRPFDKSADGTILGEGIGMMVLKRLEDAVRDGNRIYALVKGVGLSSDGRGLSVTAPRKEGEILALQRAYERAGVSPQTVGLIEAHGTGTPVGDATEIAALTEVFGRRNGALPWCAIGSVKSNLGHLMPAAGVAGLIKAVLALHHKVLPPTLNVDEPNPAFEAEQAPFYVNSEARPWVHRSRHTPRRAGVNAFGFGGINAHVVLEEYPVEEESDLPSHYLHWDSEVFILQGKSRPELVRRAEQLQRFLSASPAVSLKDLAYTLNVELAPLDGQHAASLALVASSLEDLQQNLARALERLQDPERRKIKTVQGIYFVEQPPETRGKLAFIFPGEGSQYINMLADLCLHFPEVRAQFDVIDRVFAEHARHYMPSDYIFPRPTFSEAERKAAEARIWQMEGAVEAVLSVSRALFALLDRLQIRPDAVVGHSTGEYSAMLTSGMIDLEEEERVGQFATELNQIYQQAAAEGDVPSASLIAVGANEETVAAILEQVQGQAYIAMSNCPHQTVVASQEKAVDQIVELLRGRGLIYERLSFDRPYHTPLFAAFTERLRDFFARWLLSSPRIQAYSCTSMAPFPEDLAQSQALAVEHWKQPVEFQKTIEAMYEDGVRTFVEVGPRGNLTAFVDDILRGRPHLAAQADVIHRSGTTQLNHLVGMLAAQGAPMKLDYLYARRRPQRLDLDRPDDPTGKGKPSGALMKLATGWPPISLSEQTAAQLRAKAPALAAAPAPSQERPRPAADADHPPVPPPAALLAQPTEPLQVSASSPPQPVSEAVAPPPAARPAGAEQVVSAHLQTMEQFLTVQEEIMQAFLIGRAAPRRPASAPALTPQVSLQPTEPPAPPVQPPEPVPATAESQPAPQVQEPAPVAGDDAGRPHVTSPEGVRNALLQLVSERTGYPVEMLDLKLDLEANLGIDSIKRVEILGSFQQQTNLLQPEDMEVLSARKTLQEVLDFIEARIDEGANSEAAPAPSPAPPVPPPQTASLMPFVGQIVSLTPGEEVVAHYEISLDRDVFLRDHTLGRQVAVTDPQLRGLPVVPLTVSMEMMAEAAAVLMPGRRLVEMRDIRTYRWITVEEESVTVKLVARRHSGASGNVVYVHMYDAGADDEAGTPAAPIVEGRMIFAANYPAAPRVEAFALSQRRPSQWDAERLYEEGMFHGGAFQGVASMDAWGEDGAEATLRVMPLDGPFSLRGGRQLVTDPILLDQPGQVVAFWMMEHLAHGYVIFPFRLEALHLYGPALSPHEQVTCQARISLIGDWQVRSDLDIVRSDGRLWARLVGWEDRRFDLPDLFFRFLLSTAETVVSEPWSTPGISSLAGETFEARRLGIEAFPSGFFTAHGGIWQRVLAHLVLSRRERALWRSLETPELRRIEWLLGRVVAKDAVRQYLKRHYNLALSPADIEILPDGNGRPLVQGAWLDWTPRPPIVSISHSAGMAVAVAGSGEAGEGVGVDIERTEHMNGNVEKLAFRPEEQALLSSVPDRETNHWPLRLWCAKEAVAKALGEGMIGGPQALVVQAVDAQSGVVQLTLAGELSHWLDRLNGATLTAFTAYEGDLIVATSLYKSENTQKEGR